MRQTKAPQPRQHPALLLSRAVTDSADPTGDSDSHHTFLSGDTATSMDAAQVLGWSHEGGSLLVYTPGGVVVEITNDQNWGGVGVHLSPMYTMAEVVAHPELGDYDTTKVLEALATAMSTSIVK